MLLYVIYAERLRRGIHARWLHSQYYGAARQTRTTRRRKRTLRSATPRARGYRWILASPYSGTRSRQTAAYRVRSTGSLFASTRAGASPWTKTRLACLGRTMTMPLSCHVVRENLIVLFESTASCGLGTRLCSARYAGDTGDRITLTRCTGTGVVPERSGAGLRACAGQDRAPGGARRARGDRAQRCACRRTKT